LRNRRQSRRGLTEPIPRHGGAEIEKIKIPGEWL
jgi:hypothetical protein